MKIFDKVAIVGVGLIGGSIGLAVKKRRVAHEVTGVFRRKSTLRRALKKKAVDRATMDMREGVRDADLVILASPVLSIPALAAEAVRHVKKGAIITDVGSTKAWIVNRVEGLLGRRRTAFFVGSHPMAGSERAGVEFARADLLDGAPCIVTKTRRTDPQAMAKTVRFWRALGAKVRVMDPGSHDRSVSMISHLPHVVAYSLAGSIPAKEHAYAAEGFADTTRVASSDPNLWADIFLTNRKEIAKAGRMFERYYKKVLTAVSKGSYKDTVSALKTAKSKRDRLMFTHR